ncbi:uncharacterized protein [Onthophagus taurus]|uniref:uncharacterized protein n=1 Tax=Onthophagus taurus TaxID=166361 RepID=UPI0039BE285B
MVALSWIRSHPSRWKDFVRNRVIEIQDLPEARWSYVPSEDNPADLASHGISIRRLQDESLWWSGPHWLNKSSDCWPSHPFPMPSHVDQEKRDTVSIQLTTTASWDLKSKYSSLHKLLRITSWCFRAVTKTKTECVSDILTPAEIKRSLLFWVKATQQEHFHTEICTLQEGRTVNKSSCLYRLTPFLDSEGILRITGRLRFALLDWDEKHPMILPKESHLTGLIIDAHHRRTLHGGTHLTLSSIRRQF